MTASVSFLWTCEFGDPFLLVKLSADCLFSVVRRLRGYRHIFDPWTTVKWAAPNFYRKPALGYQKLGIILTFPESKLYTNDGVHRSS
jgi:hypothetical protein